jgi:uncharacterized membrane protein (UPF0127 family)
MNGTPLRVSRARTPWQRLRGLLGTQVMDAGCGLLLDPCWAVHTLGMNRSIDVVFLNSLNQILAIEHALAPRRFAWCWTACRVLELEEGRASEAGLQRGVLVNWIEF